MRKSFHSILGTLTLAATAMAGNQTVITATQDGVYQLGYAANLGAGDSNINLTNSGASATTFDSTICANVYVLADDQQLIACCSCQLTPNHLQTLSVVNNLIANTLTPGIPTDVTIAMIASSGTGTGGVCNPATPTAEGPPGSDVLVRGLVTWGTTIHAQPAGGYSSNDYETKNATLSAVELAKLTSYCAFIEADGSGFGICKTCGQGAAGAARQ